MTIGSLTIGDCAVFAYYSSLSPDEGAEQQAWSEFALEQLNQDDFPSPERFLPNDLLTDWLMR